MKGLQHLLCRGDSDDAAMVVIGTFALLPAGLMTLSIDLALWILFMITFLCRFCCGIERRCNIDAIFDQFEQLSFTSFGYHLFDYFRNNDD
jgi:hypothetical protein